MDQSSRAIEEIQESWVSGHLYYHQDLNLAVQRLVHPLVVSLVQSGLIDAFFFVRDGLGGPHIRLRLRVTPAARNRVIEEMHLSAQRFLASDPSTRSLDEAAIRRSNEYILAVDPHEIDDSVYPDNTFRVIPFRPEIERYGGLGLFRESLDFFTLSSAAAIEFLSQHGDRPRSADLAHAFRLLLKQALGFAADLPELCDLLRYGVDSWGDALPKVVEKGDKVAHAQMDVFLTLFEESLAKARSLLGGSESPGAAQDLLVVGACRLSDAIGPTDRETRARIGGSQLHMTATRLGLSNAEEVYLSRLLTTTLQAVRSDGREDLAWLDRSSPGGSAVKPAGSPGSLLSPTLAALARVPMSRRS